MKKDITIPEVKDVFIAIVNEYNNAFKCNDWNAYIINNKETALEMVLIVSKGYDSEENKETSTIRRKIEELPAKSFAKIELVQNDVLELTNTFAVTYFENSKMFDKTFIFEKGSVTSKNLVNVPLINKQGVIKK
ncbi:MAG TPA: hypothetical protein VJ970_03225 [Flavobacteriaceae bacterium]|nr:hypothetical protein [Flavobacteriaceae bacterium]